MVWRRNCHRGALAQESGLAQQLEDVKAKIRENFGDDALDAEGNLTKYADSPRGQQYLELRDQVGKAKLRPELEADIFSACAKLLDAELQQWRERPLATFPYLVLDARYEKVRQAGQLLDCAVLLALGVNPEGQRVLLGVSVALSEAEVHWRTFLQSLCQRGLCGVEFIVSDDHAGLKAARTAVFPAIPWQRCQFQLQQNAQAYVPRLEQRAEVGRAIRSVLDSASRPAAELRLKEIVAHYAPSAPKLAAWLEENLPQGLTVFALPVEHQKKMRTSNALERVNQEIKRRTRVARLFPNEASLLRLVTALVAETSDEWETGKIYLNLKPKTQPSV